jgi:hypothetical protein
MATALFVAAKVSNGPSRPLKGVRRWGSAFRLDLRARPLTLNLGSGGGWLGWPLHFGVKLLLLFIILSFFSVL